MAPIVPGTPYIQIVVNPPSQAMVNTTLRPPPVVLLEMHGEHDNYAFIQGEVMAFSVLTGERVPGAVSGVAFGEEYQTVKPRSGNTRSYFFVFKTTFFVPGIYYLGFRFTAGGEEIGKVRCWQQIIVYPHDSVIKPPKYTYGGQLPSTMFRNGYQALPDPPSTRRENPEKSVVTILAEPLRTMHKDMRPISRPYAVIHILYRPPVRGGGSVRCVATAIDVRTGNEVPGVLIEGSEAEGRQYERYERLFPRNLTGKRNYICLFSHKLTRNNTANNPNLCIQYAAYWVPEKGSAVPLDSVRSLPINTGWESTNEAMTQQWRNILTELRLTNQCPELQDASFTDYKATLDSSEGRRRREQDRAGRRQREFRTR
ncbi:hypothetical protein B0T19DRAFT_445649 [Cercophora scortea]|uniref:Uncharacterized protein n=1 Tax=Cercophora scortea TaxID=314031 RepID=A0AAE0M5C2_9PEZI|nr:hypothetical protein B0T19DRAFT_445649 [Cercophora scortea]